MLVDPSKLEIKDRICEACGAEVKRIDEWVKNGDDGNPELVELRFFCVCGNHWMHKIFYTKPTQE